MANVYKLNFSGNTGTSIPSGTSVTSSDGVVKMTIINSGSQIIEYSDQNQYVHFNGSANQGESNTSYIEIEILESVYAVYSLEQEFRRESSSGRFYLTYYIDNDYRGSSSYYTNSAVTTNTKSDLGGYNKFRIKSNVSGSYSVTLTLWREYTVYYTVENEPYLSAKYYPNERIWPPSYPKKTGYTFSGWIDLPENMPDNDVYANGYFIPNDYTITYMVDDSQYAQQTYHYGDTITAPTAPTKTGYTFTGWSPSLPATMPAMDKTVTAQFSAADYTLTYKAAGSTYTTQTYHYGDTVTPPANPTIPGQAFNGWTNLPSTMPANDVEVSASLTPIDYTLSYYVDSSLWNSDTYHYGDAITARSVPEKHLYTSLGWSPSVPATMPANDLSVSAVYEANSLSSQYVFDSLDELPKFREKLYNDTTEATRKGNLLNVVASPYSEAYLDENEEEINVYPVYVITPSAAQVKSGYYLRQMPVPDPIYLKVEDSFFELTFEKKRENGIIYTLAEEAATETPTYYYEVSSTDVIYGDKFGVLYEMLVPNSENFANLTGNQLTIASHSYTRTSSIINDKVVFEHNYTFDSDFISSWEIDTNLNELEEAQIHRIFFISGQAEVEVPDDSSLFLHIFYPFGTEIDWTDLLSKYKASGLDETDLTQYKITGFLGTTPKMGKENLIVEINYDKILPDDFIVLTYIADDEIYSVYPATPNSSVVPKPEQNPVKKGYDFVAWDPSISTVPAVDTSLYATWTEAQDSSTVDPSTDSSVEPRYTAAYYLDDVLYHTVSLHEGDEFEVLPDVVRTGYVFSGWKMHDDSAIPSAMPAADISLDATMEERQPSLHTLTYKLDDTTYKAYQVDYGWPLTEDPIVIRQGKLFSGWHWPDNTKPLTMPDNDVTVNGSLSNDPDYGIDLPDDPTESSHVLTYYYNSSVYGTQTYAYDASIVPLAAPTSPGEDYTWSGWLGIPETMPAHDVTTLGRYLKPDDSSDSSSGGSTKAYMVRYVTKPGGARDDTQTVVVKTVDVSQGTVHTVDCSLNLDEGIIFDGWYLDSSIV